MSGFGTNSAMGSSSLPSRVVYNTGNDLPVEYIYDQGLSYPATNGYAYYGGMCSSKFLLNSFYVYLFWWSSCITFLFSTLDRI